MDKKVMTRFKMALEIYSVEKIKNLNTIKLSSNTMAQLKIANVKKRISKK